mmetsp:Transcript_24835/g.44158  ORF Transcript_24835/g.44158 Transcript_24835/m.44158 type:complete len:250 (-) Transcript_24835:115-864(-)|eukprot:CAMPEP_0205904460 /NCGR_PEP_ID=MMETSP1325-20131115/733_1 /ASSEMBLY_ACC=CAM_ASM_000708 /TAXON_ID=236786 /ORGANISM="Florenciella sp., Strain RCC1007" /LENGTH=249 /DNA_ID=CAMNT_0053270241 /DNA_START=72 /DNA_END=821 /DNA_ORIENTATION=+
MSSGLPWEVSAGVGTPAAGGPHQHTSRPIVTGTSVLGIKYRDGVMLAADTLCSYGTLAMFKDAKRLTTVGETTIVGAGGEFSDFQQIQHMLEEITDDDRNYDDGYNHSPSEIYHYLRAVMYQRRNKMNPLWNNLLIGGFKDGEAFLGTVDMIGTAFTDEFVATGFGAHLALPILRKRWHADMEEGEARELLEDCLRVLFYRDCRALNKVQVAKATAEGTMVSDPYTISTNWSSASFMQNAGNLQGDGGW